MAEKIITPIDLKVPSEENLRRIISILKGLMAQTSQIAEQCIVDFDPETIYTSGRACFKDGSLYLAITTHQGAWDDRHFELVDGTTVEYLSRQDIADLFQDTSAELWDYLGGIISDEISTKKTWHSSRIYEELMDVYARAVEYTIKYNARQQKASYKVITREADILDTQFIYLIKDGDGYQMWILTDDGPLNIGSTNIDMSEYYTRDEVDAEFLKSVDAVIQYATNDKVDGLIDDAETAETSTYSSKKIEEDFEHAHVRITNPEPKDLNLFVEEGVYTIGSLGGYSNQPQNVGSFGNLIVTVGKNYTTQEWIPGTEGCRRAWRNYIINKDEWNEWNYTTLLKDSATSAHSTWSSSKIENKFNDMGSISLYYKNQSCSAYGAMPEVEIATLPAGHKYIVAFHFETSSAFAGVTTLFNGTATIKGSYNNAHTVRYNPQNGGGADAIILYDATKQDAVITCTSYCTVNDPNPFDFRYSVQVMTLV